MCLLVKVLLVSCGFAGLKNETKKEHVGPVLAKPQPLPPPCLLSSSPFIPLPPFSFHCFSPSIFLLFTSLPLLYLSVQLSFELVLGSSQCLWMLNILISCYLLLPFDTNMWSFRG